MKPNQDDDGYGNQSDVRHDVQDSRRNAYARGIDASELAWAGDAAHVDKGVTRRNWYALEGLEADCDRQQDREETDEGPVYFHPSFRRETGDAPVGEGDAELDAEHAEVEYGLLDGC